MLSITEENYLKALLRITEGSDGNPLQVGTNLLAQELDVRPPSTTDMLKKLRDKGLVNYEKYGKISLTPTGKEQAIAIVRRHRLWETFLYDKLGFGWEQVHDLAEQLEHIQSDQLIEKLDRFLGYPQFDPHGDIIPTANGEFPSESLEYRLLLADATIGQPYLVVGVKDNNPDLLQYIRNIGLTINSKLHVLEYFSYDQSFLIEIDNIKHHISAKIANNIYCRSQNN